MTLCISCNNEPRYRGRLIGTVCIALEARERRAAEAGGLPRPKGRPNKSMQQNAANKLKPHVEPVTCWSRELSNKYISQRWV